MVEELDNKEKTEIINSLKDYINKEIKDTQNYRYVMGIDFDAKPKKIYITIQSQKIKISSKAKESILLYEKKFDNPKSNSETEYFKKIIKIIDNIREFINNKPNISIGVSHFQFKKCFETAGSSKHHSKLLWKLFKINSKTYMVSLS